MSTLTTSAVSVNRETLSLQQLHAALKERGLPIGYSTLSDFLGTGDIAEQLGISGSGSRRSIHPDIVDVFAAFYPEFKAAGGKVPQAPAMLRSFLKQRNSTDLRNSTNLTIIGETTSLVPVNQSVEIQVRLSEVQGRAQGLAQAEQVLNAKEASSKLGISVSMLRKTIPAWRRFGNSPRGDRWRSSDLLG